MGSQGTPRSITKERSAQMASAVPESLPSTKHAAPPPAQRNSSNKLEPVQYRRTHTDTESKDSCGTLSPEPPNSSQTPTIAASHGVDRSLAFNSTLKRISPPSRSQIKNLGNHNSSIAYSAGRHPSTFNARHLLGLDQQSRPMAAAASSPSRASYQNSDSLHRQAAHNSHPHWRTYTFVDVFVQGLPPNVTTLDLYKNFIQHGEIAIITLKNSPGGAWKNQADIRFK